MRGNAGDTKELDVVVQCYSDQAQRRSAGGKRDVVLWMDDGRRGEGGGLTRVSVAADWMFYADVRDVASSLESCHGSVWIAG